MQLEIAGVCHPDPLGRQNLTDWLRSLSVARENSPAFVAVEWDPDIFQQVKSQRPLLRELLAKEWADAGSQFIDTLVDALAFEGDAHEDVFPDALTVWLDQGRTLDDQTKVTQFAQDRLANYRSMFDVSLGSYSADQLHRMSQAAWSSVNCRNPMSSRDDEFAQVITSEAEPSDPGWAVLIVGVCHARKGLGFLRDVLDEIGFECNSFDVRKDDQDLVEAT